MFAIVDNPIYRPCRHAECLHVICCADNTFARGRLSPDLVADTMYKLHCHAQASRVSTAAMAPLSLHTGFPVVWGATFMHQCKAPQCSWVLSACHLPHAKNSMPPLRPHQGQRAPAPRKLQHHLPCGSSGCLQSLLCFDSHLGGVNLFIRTGPPRQPTPTEANMKPSVWLLSPSDCISGSSLKRTCRGKG